MASRDLLDRVRTVDGADSFAANSYAAALAAELPGDTSIAELEARDAALATALAAIDELALRVMRLRLDHALADDSSLPAPTRKVFAATVINYADDLGLLARRVHDVVARSSADPQDVVDKVVGAARATLELRAALRDQVLDLVRSLARAAIPNADARARDRDADERARKRWSAVRRDLEMLVGDPRNVLVAPFASRIASWPEQLDEPAPEPEQSLAELIELD